MATLTGSAGDQDRPPTLPVQPIRHGGWWARRQRHLAPYLFVLPFFALFLVTLAGPIAFAIWLSFHEWNLIEPMTWRGFANYAEIVRDDSFQEATRNTVQYVVASLLIICPLSLFLAAGLNARQTRVKDLLRTAYFLPIVLSPVVVSIVFSIVFDRDYGLMNAFLRGVLGLQPVDWLGTPRWARVAIVIMIAWRWTGYTMIYFLAGMQNIPRELYEAAEVDGAGATRTFFDVTLPMLRPVVAFVAVVVLIGSSQVFEEPYILTRGGPGEATLSIANYIQREGFERLNMGGAATASCLLFVAVFLATQVQLRLFGVGREDR